MITKLFSFSLNCIMVSTKQTSPPIITKKKKKKSTQTNKTLSMTSERNLLAKMWY